MKRSLPSILWLLLLSSAPAAAQSLCTTIQTYGGSGNGTTDNVSALVSAYNAISGTGGCISFPPGRYYFSASVDYLMPSSRRSVSIVGSGIDSTTLYFPSGNGLQFSYGSMYNSVTIHDLSITTGSANAGAAIQLRQTQPEGVFSQTFLYNLFIRGDDGGALSNYWTYGIFVSGVAGINFNNIAIYGGTDGTGYGTGTGIFLSGNSGYSPYYGIVYNLSGCNLFWLADAVVYDAYTQGVTVHQCNFSNDGAGIVNDPSQSGVLGQLSISDSQFGPIKHWGIYLQTAIADLQVSNSLFYATAGNAVISLIDYEQFSITGNMFELNGSASGSAGIYVGAPQGPSSGWHGVISGNSFTNVQYGVDLSSSSQYINVQSNSYGNVATPVQNLGTHNVIGGGSG